MNSTITQRTFVMSAVDIRNLSQPRIPLVDILHRQISPRLQLPKCFQPVKQQPVVLPRSIADIQHRYLLFYPGNQPIPVNIHRRATVDVRPDGLNVYWLLCLDKLIHLLVDSAHNNAQAVVQCVSVWTLHNGTSPVLSLYTHARINII